MQLRTRFPSQDRSSLRVLQQLTIPRTIDSPPHRVQVPIWPAIQVRRSMERFEIQRLNQRRALELTAEARDLDLYSVATRVQSVIQNISSPPGYEIRLGQSFEEMQETRREIFFALALALLLIYMVMAALFESFRTPLVIMCSVPLALVGTVAALWLSGFAVSTAVYVGALALAGIVVSNAIVLVDHINQLRNQGHSFLRAVMRGTQDRLRPILITSVTAILGLLPLALERQEGYQLWSPLAWTVIGGLVSATFLTLFILPAVYVMVMAPGSVKTPNTNSLDSLEEMTRMVRSKALFFLLAVLGLLGSLWICGCSSGGAPRPGRQRGQKEPALVPPGPGSLSPGPQVLSRTEDGRGS